LSYTRKLQIRDRAALSVYEPPSGVLDPIATSWSIDRRCERQRSTAGPRAVLRIQPRSLTPVTRC